MLLSIVVSFSPSQKFLSVCGISGCDHGGYGRDKSLSTR